MHAEFVPLQVVDGDKPPTDRELSIKHRALIETALQGFLNSLDAAYREGIEAQVQWGFNPGLQRHQITMLRVGKMYA